MFGTRIWDAAITNIYKCESGFGTWDGCYICLPGADEKRLEDSETLD